MAGHARLACDEAGHWDERLGEGRTGRPARRGQRGGFGGQNTDRPAGMYCACAQLRSKIRVGFNLHDQLFFCDAKHINTPAAAIPGLAGCGPYTKT
jgi:hypothetical protein